MWHLTGRCFINSISILGSGWLSVPLAQRLVQLGHDVRMSTRNVDKQAALTAQNLETYLVDIDSDDALPADFIDSDILIIAITSKNSAGYQQLINRLAGSKVKHVLFISSSSVYQNLNREVSEDEGVEDHSRPLYQIEQQFRDCPDFTTTVLRFSGLVGPARHPGRFFRGGKTVKQPDAPINLIHLDDCIGLIECIIQQSAWGEVFNGCSDTHPVKREFYPQVADAIGMPCPEFSAAQSLSYKIVGNDKIKQKLGYQLRHPDLLKLYTAASPQQ
jgi:nucleoside-diphosphate-sugar epimerase